MFYLSVARRYNGDEDGIQSQLNNTCESGHQKLVESHLMKKKCLVNEWPSLRKVPRF